MTIRPALKSGVFIHNYAHPYEIRIGSRWRFTTLPSLWNNQVSTRALLTLFDGKTTTSELAAASGLELSAIERLIEELRKHDVVDLYRTPIAYLRRYNPELGRIEDVSDLDEIAPDFATETALKRIEIESDAATFASGDVDGGRSAVIKRRSFRIVIFGYGKIVNTLAGVLSASGFSKLSVINRVGVHDPALKILESDVAGGYVTRSHFGQVRKKIVDEIRDNALLFVEPKVQIQNPDLIISIGNPSPDSIQRWMAENTRHLLVEIATSSEVRIGPLVTPGKTPCFRCIQLSESAEWPHEKSPEVGAALALTISAAIAHDVIALSDRSSSIYHQTSYTYSTHDYVTPRIQHWSQHHACGCSWGG